MKVDIEFLRSFSLGMTVGPLSLLDGYASFFHHIEVTKRFSEIDSTELSARGCDLKSLQSFRSRTSNFVRQSLGFPVAEDNVVLGPPESDPVITSFGIVGKALKTSYTLGRSCNACIARNNQRWLTAWEEQRERLLEHIEFFFEMSTMERNVALEDSLPSMDEYLGRRMGTSAVRVCNAMTE